MNAPAYTRYWRLTDVLNETTPDTKCTETDMQARIQHILCGRTNNLRYIVNCYEVTNRLCISIFDEGMYAMTMDLDDTPSPEGSLIAPVLTQYEPLIRFLEQQGLVTCVLHETYALGDAEVVYVEFSQDFIPDKPKQPVLTPITPLQFIDQYAIACARIALNEDDDLDGLELSPNHWWLVGAFKDPQLADIIGATNAFKPATSAPRVWMTRISDDYRVLLPTPGVLARVPNTTILRIQTFDDTGQLDAADWHALESEHYVCPTEHYADLVLKRCVDELVKRATQTRDSVNAALRAKHDAC